MQLRVIARGLIVLMAVGIFALSILTAIAEDAQCVEQRLQVEQLKQQNAALQLQNAQLQFRESKTEEERLKGQLPTQQAQPPSAPPTIVPASPPPAETPVEGKTDAPQQ